MNQELYFVLTLLAAAALALGIYLLATRQNRRATECCNILCNSVWQVNASLRTREWELQSEDSHPSVACARGFNLMQELSTLVEECNEHRDVAQAWLLMGRAGYPTVQLRYDLGLAAVGRFHHTLRRYDKALAS
ncbi:MAG: hypothetical protein SGJ27_00535 [Candidatus Melainabacteria bacterium]|nr:hypothetical protein [Candidatus Melainabacteria bacterium]